MKIDLGKSGHQPREDEPDEEREEGPQKEGQRNTFPAQIIPQRDWLVILQGEPDGRRQNEEENGPFEYSHGPGRQLRNFLK